MRFEQKMTLAWALGLKASCTQGVIAALQTMDDEMLSGDSGLANVWEEICAQVQGAQSADWSTYEDVIESLVHAKVELLGREQQLAIWAQTDDGWAWVHDHFDEDDSDDTAPLDVHAVCRLIVEDVISAASDYESRTLYRFLWDAEDEEDEEEEEEEEKEEEDVCPASEPK